MKPTIIDTHAHLDMPHFNKDRAEVVFKALESGVSTIITVGIDLESSRKAIKLAESYKEIFATAGFHPHEASRVKEASLAELAEIAKHPRVVAIGELGLDFYRNRSPREAQLQALRWQLEMATEVDLPVVIHSRQAEKDMLAALRDWASHCKHPDGEPVGVVHCFGGDTDTARQYLDMGFLISLGAYIGYPASLRSHHVIRSIPLDKLMVETDCPFLPPQSHRGKRNEPAYLPLTVKLLAEIKQVPPETVARETTRNACKLFRLPEPA